ncbi:AAA family ATPase [Turicibacter sp. TJ11]|uniref:AAA family ATPase n=1 Tax=Turicibacter sp. TJ11 TaxID=2806443 RepID=UPI001F42B15D|nr:AAA family ATPase [Turicibacter sp. TJ11]
MNQTLKDWIDYIYRVGDKLDEFLTTVHTPTRDILKIEFLKFLMYLCTSDCTVSDQQVTFIKKYLGYNLSPNDIKEMINQNQTYRIDFENNIPYSMKLFVTADNEEFDDHFLISEYLYTVYSILGESFLNCDLAATEDEKRSNQNQNFDTYLRRIKGFIRTEVRREFIENKAIVIKQIKNIMNQLYEYGDELDELLTMIRIPFREILKIELLNFLVYLSSLCWTEPDHVAKFIKEYLDYDLSCNEIKKRMNKIDYENYKSAIPIGMYLCVMADNNHFYDFLVSHYLYRIYYILGRLFLMCEPFSINSGVQYLNKYLTTLDDFIGTQVIRENSDGDFKYQYQSLIDSFNLDLNDWLDELGVWNYSMEYAGYPYKSDLMLDRYHDWNAYIKFHGFISASDTDFNTRRRLETFREYYRLSDLDLGDVIEYDKLEAKLDSDSLKELEEDKSEINEIEENETPDSIDDLEIDFDLEDLMKELEEEEDKSEINEVEENETPDLIDNLDIDFDLEDLLEELEEEKRVINEVQENETPDSIDDLDIDFDLEDLLEELEEEKRVVDEVEENETLDSIDDLDIDFDLEDLLEELEEEEENSEINKMQENETPDSIDDLEIDFDLEDLLEELEVEEDKSEINEVEENETPDLIDDLALYFDLEELLKALEDLLEELEEEKRVINEVQENETPDLIDDLNLDLDLDEIMEHDELEEKSEVREKDSDLLKELEEEEDKSEINEVQENETLDSIEDLDLDIDLDLDDIIEYDELEEKSEVYENEDDLLKESEEERAINEMENEASDSIDDLDIDLDLDEIMEYDELEEKSEVYENENDLLKESEEERAINEMEENRESDLTESIDDLLQQLDSLTGLENVKEEVHSLINLLRIRKIREERGLINIPLSLHLIFSGNPGTGKTTVARLLGEIYHRLDVLSKGHLVELNCSTLAGGYVEQTTLKLTEVVEKSLGGILFVNEPYSLMINKLDNDLVNALLTAMEVHRDDFIMIVSGSPEPMDEFLNSYPELHAQFNKQIHFSDYSSDELVHIFEGMCHHAGYRVSVDCTTYVRHYFEKRCLERDINFKNGREVRDFFEKAMMNQANRLSMTQNITDQNLIELTVEDVEQTVLDLGQQLGHKKVKFLSGLSRKLMTLFRR